MNRARVCIVCRIVRWNRKHFSKMPLLLRQIREKHGRRKKKNQEAITTATYDRFEKGGGRFSLSFPLAPSFTSRARAKQNSNVNCFNCSIAPGIKFPAACVRVYSRANELSVTLYSRATPPTSQSTGTCKSGGEREKEKQRDAIWHRDAVSEKHRGTDACPSGDDKDTFAAHRKFIYAC